MFIITGASSGIGREVALALASKCPDKEMILISRRDPQITSGEWLKCDLSAKNQLTELVTKLKQKVQKLDLIVHCAGVMKSQSSSSLSIDDSVESFMVNTIAPLCITSSLSRQLAKAKGVAIVISSIASKLDIPGECIYSATKSGLDKGFESLSADLSRLGINFLKIHPVMIDTPMTSQLTASQKDYMHQQRVTKQEPTARELAEFIVGLREYSFYATGSSIYFGGIRRQMVMDSANQKIDTFSKGLPFPLVDANQVWLSQKLCGQLSATITSIHICTINAEIAHQLLNTYRSQVVLKSVSYFIPDGIGVALAFKYLLGVDVGKLPGIEFADELLNQCNELGWNVALYGATNERVALASKHIQKKYANMAITAILDGYASLDEVTNFLLQCQKDTVKLVLVALGHPAQDEFISKHLDSFPAIWVGVGGSFDVWLGAQKRAPVMVSMSGLEWLYRILQEPSFKRIKRSLDLPLFCLDMLLYRMQAFLKRCWVDTWQALLINVMKSTA